MSISRRSVRRGHRRLGSAVTLVNEIVYKSLANRLPGARQARRARDGRGDRGLRQGDRDRPAPDRPHAPLEPGDVHDIFTHIRELYSLTPDAARLQAGRFSFNVGRALRDLQGDGQIKIEMHFLPDVYVPCETCKGRRHNRETLGAVQGQDDRRRARDVGRGGAALLRQTEDPPAAATLHDVGLDYMTLGQPATTLSGGSAAREARRRACNRRRRTSTSSTSRRPGCTSRTSRAARGAPAARRHRNTVLVIEHNLDVIKQADWLVDLGPEGGDAGGELIATGTPEDVASHRLLHRSLPATAARTPLGDCRLTWRHAAEQKRRVYRARHPCAHPLRRRRHHRLPRPAPPICKDGSRRSPSRTPGSARSPTAATTARLS